MVRFGKSKQRFDYEVNSTPGPKYWVRELFGKDAKKISFSKSLRPELYNTTTDTPFGKYDLPESDKISRNISFGASERFQTDLQSRIDPVGTPGPLETSTVSAFKFHVDTPSYTIQGRHKDVARYMGKFLSIPLVTAPPPGLYYKEEVFNNPNIDSTKRKPVEIKFNRSDRDYNPAFKSSAPGPVYDIRDSYNSRNIRNPTAHFGTTSRPPLYNLYAAEFPGPVYNPSFKLVMKNEAHGVPWGKNKNSIVKKSIQSPGPGYYTWDKESSHSPQVYFFGKWKEKKIDERAPDPTKYSKRESIGEDAPKISFTKQGLSLDDLSKPKIKLSGKGYKRLYVGKAFKPMESDPDIPDGGIYSPQYDSTFLSRNQRSPSITFGPPRSKTPSIKKKSQNQNRPNTTSEMYNSPGPGQYDIIPGLRSLSQSRRISSVKWIQSEGKQKSSNSDTPGPKYKPKLDRFSGLLLDSSKGNKFGGLQ